MMRRLLQSGETMRTQGCQEALRWTEEDPGVGVKPYALDADNAQRLWEVAAKLAGMPAK